MSRELTENFGHSANLDKNLSSMNHIYTFSFCMRLLKGLGMNSEQVVITPHVQYICLWTKKNNLNHPLAIDSPFQYHIHITD